MTIDRTRISGGLLLLGGVTFWASWALMPMPGTRDAAFIVQAVAAARTEVLVSCALQLLSAAAWAAALVLLPAPHERATAWWAGASALAVGVTGSAADAIYHLVAYELTAPDVSAEVAALVMQRVQGADLLLLLPSVGAFFVGVVLLPVAAVRLGRAPRTSLHCLWAAVLAAAVAALLPGDLAPRVAALLALALLVAPVSWLGLGLLRGGSSAG